MTCTWTPEPGCLGSEWDGLSDELRERSLMLATSALVNLTNGRVGACPVTIRPCPDVTTRCGCDWLKPYNYGGRWYNGCGCRAECAPTYEVEIPGPVGFIEEIKVDGVPLDLNPPQGLGDLPFGDGPFGGGSVSGNGQWRLDNGHLLVWQGPGPSPIPPWQNLDLPDTEPGTWSITYSNSYPVGRDGRLAVALLAMEFAKACLPKAKCSLPRGVTSVTRQGVSFTIEAGLFPNGLTGIDVVDQFILKWTPIGSPVMSAKVFDPRRIRGNARRTSSIPRRGL